MSKSNSLRLNDIRAVFRLIGDCRDLGREPSLWQRRMLEGLSILFGVMIASAGEAWWLRPGRPVQPVSAYSVSAEPAAEAAFLAYHRSGASSIDPIFGAIDKIRGKLITRSRPQLVADADWQRSVVCDQFYRPAGILHPMVSVSQVSPAGATSVIALHRPLGERDFSSREQRILHFFHAELSRLIGGPLVGATDPSAAQLSPRLQQTLAYLIEGDSEKQVAARLGLSPTTVHQYVTALYRHFKIHSRAQLVAHVVRRDRSI